MMFGTKWCMWGLKIAFHCHPNPLTKTNGYPNSTISHSLPLLRNSYPTSSPSLSLSNQPSSPFLLIFQILPIILIIFSFYPLFSPFINSTSSLHIYHSSKLYLPLYSITSTFHISFNKISPLTFNFGKFL